MCNEIKKEIKMSKKIDIDALKNGGVMKMLELEERVKPIESIIANSLQRSSTDQVNRIVVNETAFNEFMVPIYKANKNGNTINRKDYKSFTDMLTALDILKK
jgi:hypothetical protein